MIRKSWLPTTLKSIGKIKKNPGKTRVLSEEELKEKQRRAKNAELLAKTKRSDATTTSTTSSSGDSSREVDDRFIPLKRFHDEFQISYPFAEFVQFLRDHFTYVEATATKSAIERLRAFEKDVDTTVQPIWNLARGAADGAKSAMNIKLTKRQTTLEDRKRLIASFGAGTDYYNEHQDTLLKVKRHLQDLLTATTVPPSEEMGELIDSYKAARRVDGDITRVDYDEIFSKDPSVTKGRVLQENGCVKSMHRRMH